MDGTHLIDALARVIAERSGRTPERVIAALSRDVDDPEVWKSQGYSKLEKDDSEMHRLRWQRAQTRRSRLVVRLCEELVASATGVVRTDETLGTSLSYFQQLSSSIMLHQHGHLQAGAELAHRALQRAASAGESAFAVLAADVIVAMQERPVDEPTHVRFDAQRRRWRDVDHGRRMAEHHLIHCLEFRRQICDRSKEPDLEQALLELRVIAEDSTDPIIDICISALVVQQNLLRRKNHEAISAVDDVAKKLTILPAHMQWMGQWLMIAQVKAYLAIGEYATARKLTEALNPETFHRRFLKCDAVRLHTIAAMRNGEWEKARLAMIQAMTVDYEQIDAIDKQRLMVLIAFYNLGAILRYHSEPITARTMRVSSLMNSIELVLQDKMGLAPIALSYEVMAYLLQGDIELAERKMSNLQVYSTRNLRFHGATAMRAFISLLRMIVFHKGAFTSDERRVRLFMSRITDEHESATEQMICPLPLRKLAQTLIEIINGRLDQTSV